MPRSKEPQLYSYIVTSFGTIIPYENDLDSLVGHLLLSTLNESTQAKGREIPFDVMPKIYRSFGTTEQSLRMQGENAHAAYNMVCEMQEYAKNWTTIPSGRGTPGERITRKARFLRGELERRGPLSGAKNLIYIADYDYIQRHFL